MFLKFLPTGACFILAPHRASVFFYVLRSFILSSFIQQVFLSICYVPGLLKEWSNGGQQNRQNLFSRNLDLEIFKYLNIITYTP